MNKNRRIELADIISQLTELQNRVEMVMNEEQESFDNLSENLQGSMRATQMEDAVDNLDAAIDSIGEAISAIEEASV